MMEKGKCSLGVASTITAAVLSAALFLPCNVAEGQDGPDIPSATQTRPQGRLDGSGDDLRVRRGPTVNTCEDCPEPGSIACIISPLVCDACWETCGETTQPVRRVGPARSYYIDRNLGSPRYVLPRTVGVQQLAYDLNWEAWGNPIPHPHARWTTKELLDDIRANGIRAVKLWFKGDPFDGMGEWCWSPYYWTGDEPFSCQFGDHGFEDMMRVWSHWGVTTFTVRFINGCWSIQEHNSCTLATWEDCKPSGITFANEPTYDIARGLLERVGWMDAVVIFADWEQDWSIRGQNSRGYDDAGQMKFPWADAPTWYRTTCIEELSEQECGEMLVAERAAYVKSTIQRRQRDVMRARAEFPRSNLRVLHSVIFNRYPSNIEETGLGYTVLDLVMELDVVDRPDLLGISFWDRHATITDALDWAQQKTGYPRSRFYVDEFGEWREGQQYLRIWNEGRRAQCWGVNLLNVWTWRQTFCSTTAAGSVKNHGLFYQLNCPKPSDFPQQPVQFGEPRPGYQAVQDLNRWVPSAEECAEVMALPPTADSK